MGINHIVIFEGYKRMNISIDEIKQNIKDVTLMHGDEELLEIMELIAHKSIKDAIKCLKCDNINNKHVDKMIDILNCYN